MPSLFLPQIHIDWAQKSYMVSFVVPFVSYLVKTNTHYFNPSCWSFLEGEGRLFYQIRVTFYCCVNLKTLKFMDTYFN